MCAHARAGYWRRDGPLGQNPCQKVEEIVNGWKRASGTMHTQTCMVPLGNLHSPESPHDFKRHQDVAGYFKVAS